MTIFRQDLKARTHKSFTIIISQRSNSNSWPTPEMCTGRTMPAWPSPSQSLPGLAWNELGSAVMSQRHNWISDTKVVLSTCSTLRHWQLQNNKNSTSLWHSYTYDCMNCRHTFFICSGPPKHSTAQPHPKYSPALTFPARRSSLIYPTILSPSTDLPCQTWYHPVPTLLVRRGITQYRPSLSDVVRVNLFPHQARPACRRRTKWGSASSNNCECEMTL